MSSRISPSVLEKITELFKLKKWPINSNGATSFNLYDKFCARVSLFDPTQQELFIALAQKFVQIGLKEYLESFYDSFFCLDSDIVFDNDTYIYPLYKPFSENVNNGKTKSCQFLHYMIECDDYTWISGRIKVRYSIESLFREFDNEKSYLILVDDYVGSGKTAVDVCNEFLNNDLSKKINYQRIKIVSIAAQKQGIDTVKNNTGIDVVSNIILSRGISDFFPENLITSQIDRMLSMEKKLKIKKEYSLGYEKTEGLITFMNKTPNNTFPVFWHETSDKVAPFPRYKLYKYDK